MQQAFLDAEAFQCGYCTSGMVMATVGLLRTNAEPVATQDIARLMDRNVCRCGTYPRIVKAVRSWRRSGCARARPRSEEVMSDPVLEA